MLKIPTFPTGRPIAPGNTPVQGRQVQLKHADAKRMIENRKLPGKVFDPKKKPRGASLASPTDSFPPIVDLEALADALDNDADKIYHYVANSIEFLPTFGSQKGALGALLDRQGNSFDISALMVQILTEAGYTAKLMFGELRITAADAGAWLGTEPTDAWASRNLLANGGIPADVEWHAPSSTYYVILSHVFVKCNIGGTNYMFDPARKTYTTTAGIDIETVTGYDETDLHTAAFTGATVTADYVQDVNTTNLET